MRVGEAYLELAWKDVGVEPDRPTARGLACPTQNAASPDLDQADPSPSGRANKDDSPPCPQATDRLVPVESDHCNRAKGVIFVLFTTYLSIILAGYK